MTIVLFRRLLPWLLACVAGLATAAPYGPAPAELVPGKSQLGFVLRQMGVPVEGAFARFKAQVAFDPRRPEGGSIVLAIDTGSASLGVPQSDAELPKPEWFDAAKFPQAVFRAGAIRALGAGRFEAAGRLTLKGATQELVVPFTLTPADGGLTVAAGSLTIQRLAFKVGDGEWTDTSMIANDVQVRFRFTLSGLGPP